MKEENTHTLHSSLVGKSSSQIPSHLKKPQGFAKIIAGGRIVRPDPSKPEIERMVTGNPTGQNEESVPGSHAKAVLESVSANLEAGIELVDRQETALAKIGGKLSEIALVLNQTKAPNANHEKRVNYQTKFIHSRDGIRELAKETFDQVALFSNGPAKPVTIAVPSVSTWEGINIDRANLKQPGLETVDNGKVYGESPGFFLDAGSISKAFKEWRGLCIQNRLQWGLLIERLHGINRSLEKFRKDRSWKIPSFSTKQKMGPLRRANRNN